MSGQVILIVPECEVQKATLGITPQVPEAFVYSSGFFQTGSLTA